MENFNVKEYWEAHLAKNWNLEGVGYAGYGMPFNKWLYKVRKFVFNRHMRSLNLRIGELKVLDVGSGTGFYLKLWEALGAKSITGSDISSVAVGNLKKKFPEISILELDISKRSSISGFGKKKYNVVTAFDVLFHIVDDHAFGEAIKNISKLLASGGYFIFSDNFLHRKRIINVHQICRTFEEFKRHLNASDFSIVKRAPMFVLMNMPIDTIGELPSIIWRVVMLPVRWLKIFGHLYGVVLYPLEIFLVRGFKESPTTEIMICRKI